MFLEEIDGDDDITALYTGLNCECQHSTKTWTGPPNGPGYLTAGI